MKLTQTTYTISTVLVLLIFWISPSFAQVVWENPKHQVYEFLSRQAQKGTIRLDDIMQPVSRKEIARQLRILQDSSERLSAIDKEELAFYLSEYSEFDEGLTDTTTFLKRDQTGRLRVLAVKKGNFTLKGDPSLLLRVNHNEGGTSFVKGTGLKFWGNVGEHFAFQAYFQDITESGNGFDSLRTFTPEMGIVKVANTNTKVLNYTDFRGNLTYNWENGSVTLGHDQLLWGYGENGRIVLSDKAPAYPFIRLDYRPLPWLSFSYSHAWLQSGLIDSAKSYPKGNDIYGSVRKRYISKFMATHSLDFFPTKGLSLSIGESVVYNDHLQVAYLLPVMFFKAYDQYAGRNDINAGSNAQFFFQANSRNHLRNTHLYATLFIDEIRMSEVFNKEKSRNQVGYTLGGSITDVGLPTLTLGIEYTHINPFVYQNLIPAQNYSHQNYLLGDWMGSNADRLIGYVKYTPLPRLKTAVHLQKTRKGYEGSLEDQYFASPQPRFLSNLQRQDTQVLISASYQWIHNLYIDAQYNWQQNKDEIFGGTDTPEAFQLSIRLGM